jgi:hypothetical protein
VALVPVTLIEKVQEPEAARLAPAKLTVEEPAAAVIVPPPQVPLRPLGEATATPPGKLSVKPIPLAAKVELGLLMTKVRLVTPVTAMVPVPKAVVMEGGLSTVTEAEAVLPVPPLVELTLTLLFLAPAVVPVTFNEKLQLPPGPKYPELRLMLFEPAVAVTLPYSLPQEVGFRPLGVATNNPAGKVSVKAMPFSSTVFAEGLVMVKVRLVEPFNGMVLAPNTLVMEGGTTPVPGRLTFCVPLVPLLYETDRVALRFPPALGVKVTLMVQLPAAATPAMQLLVWPKSPLFAPVMMILEIVKATVPGFEIITGWEALCVLTACGLNVSEAVEKVTWPLPVPDSDMDC